MKNSRIFITIAAALALGLAGCKKPDQAAPPASGDSATPPTAPAMDISAAATNAAAAAMQPVADLKATAASVVTNAKQQAEAAKAAVNSQVQKLIDQAKNLVAESKFTDASNVLQQLAGQTLSADQQTLVDTLKEQIQKALAAKAAADAATATSNLLKR